MRIEKIKYSEFLGKPNEWVIDEIPLDKITLIIGKNASGKTRTIRVIANLCKFFTGKKELEYTGGNYVVSFKEKEVDLKVSMKYDYNKVISEKVLFNGKKVLERKEDGSGTIKYYGPETPIDMEFEIKENEIACVAKIDKKQHPFLEHLNNWANKVRGFYFGETMGKSEFVAQTSFDISEIDVQNSSSSVVPIYNIGYKKYKNKGFKKTIIEDFKKIGYNIDDIKLAGIGQVKQLDVEKEVYGIGVKESNLKSITNQREMSQGMFRALSLIIRLNYHLFSQEEGLIVIDDIGEGLDYERSKRLINLVIDKAEKSNIQLIMSTNDRFVMNEVDIKYWAILKRNKNRVKLYNYLNSKKIFDDFKFTGLNNFDFFATEFYLKGFDEKKNKKKA